ncbi:hypothetical protein [Saccharopolyspora hattusasensis]|uniref:hypothetical protein n=1 Tax=Saccharopolyspora hattusasensis TaxID=1128679 RepID=UPI003D97FAD5
MAIVSTCTYDAQGRLVRPDRLDIGRAKIDLDLDTGGFPTFDRDHVHVHIVTASGVTADQARQRVNAQLARFFERVEEVTGYSKIAISKTQGVIPCNRNVTITCEILYAVEAPKWARGHSPESPYAGYRRDRSAVAQD